MARRSELPWELRIAPFDVREAERMGISPTRLSRSDLLRPFRGVRVSSDRQFDLVERCYAYLLRMPSSGLFSHVTAARLYGAPLPRRLQLDAAVHVLVAEPHRPPQMHGVIGHRRRADTITQHGIDSLPVTSPVLTWIQLGEILSVEELVAVGDYLVSTTLERPEPFTSIAQLKAGVAANTGARGIRRLRAAIERVRTGVESPKETELRLIVVDAGFPEPVPNYTLRSPDGRHVARLDLAYPRYRVGLDYEGDIHRTSRKQFRKDVTRGEDVRDLGWRLIRVTDDDLADGAAVLLARVDRNLTAHGWKPQKSSRER